MLDVHTESMLSQRLRLKTWGGVSLLIKVLIPDLQLYFPVFKGVLVEIFENYFVEYSREFFWEKTVITISGIKWTWESKREDNSLGNFNLLAMFPWDTFVGKVSKACV